MQLSPLFGCGIAWLRSDRVGILTMPSSIELREIRVFLVLAEELNFGRTAERLGLTPSRVSQTIRSLERRVGGRLFHRTSRQVALSSLGEQLRGRVEPAYDQLERALSDVREAVTGVTGTLRLGMYSSINGGPHLLEIIRTFTDRHPDCHVRMTDTGLERDQLDWLRRDELDLLALRLPISDPGITVGPVLSSEERILAVAAGHPLSGYESVCLEDLADYAVSDTATLPREMMDAFIPPSTPSGKRLRRIENRTVGDTMMRVALGEIVHPTVMSFLEYHRQPDTVYVPIRDLPPSQTALIWLTAKHDGRIRAFARAAHDVLDAQKQTDVRPDGHMALP
jgi:DNA-binding transcriptional LysR family regulator